MALDGVLIHLLTSELAPKVNDGIVTKVTQPGKEEIVLTLKKEASLVNLYISAKSTGARLTISQKPIENPKVPPMFCMLLRKYLEGAKITNCYQKGFERIIFIDFDAFDIYGDPCKLTMIFELMGRYSNVILVNSNNTIIECLKRVSKEKSPTRPLMPGLSYFMPPPLKKHLIEVDDPIVSGLSPLIVREINGDLSRVHKYVDINTSEPVILYDQENVPIEFSYMPIKQYGNLYTSKSFDSICLMLDFFYGEKDEIERIKQRASDFGKQIENKIERIERRITAQREELLATNEREKLLKCANLLSANLYSIKQGMASVTLVDYETNEEITIKLDPLKSPNQNMQYYYKEYRKTDTAEKMLTELIQKGEIELEYLKSEYDLMNRAKSDDELLAIKEELYNTGYLKSNGKKGPKSSTKLPPLRYISSDGFTILSGRNNTQNEQLTFKTAQKDDIWLHAQKIPASHTIILTNGVEPPLRTYTEAAIIAATNSSYKGTAKIAVDYTKIKNVKHMPASKPGMVIYNPYYTIIVEPDKKLTDDLSKM